MNSGFWEGKKVLVTGHTGFKGSWLALWLQRLGAEVTGFALDPPTAPSLYDLARVGAGMTSLRGDVRDLSAVTRILAECRPEIVFHLAAQPLVRYSYAHPVETFAINVMGLVHLLEAVRRVPGVRALVCVTSDKCYQNREWSRGYREEDALGGHDPYSGSKGCSELVAAAFRSSYFAAGSCAAAGPAVASARAGNVIGGGDWAADRLVPDAVDAFRARRPLEIRNPGAVRPWQHVLEPLRGYLRLAEKLAVCGSPFAESWNFGPVAGDARPVGWVVMQLAELWGDGARWRFDDGEHPHEAGLLQLDCSKACRRLGWVPRMDLETALAWTVDWYRDFHRGADVRAATLDQIRRYEELPPK